MGAKQRRIEALERDLAEARKQAEQDRSLGELRLEQVKSLSEEIHNAHQGWTCAAREQGLATALKDLAEVREQLRRVRLMRRRGEMSGRCDSCGEVGNVWCGGCLGDPDVHNLEVRLSAAKQRAERAEAEARALRDALGNLVEATQDPEQCTLCLQNPTVGNHKYWCWAGKSQALLASQPSLAAGRAEAERKVLAAVANARDAVRGRDDIAIDPTVARAIRQIWHKWDDLQDLDAATRAPEPPVSGAGGTEAGE